MDHLLGTKKELTIQSISPPQIIQQRRQLGSNSLDAFTLFFKGFFESKIPDYQMAAFLMASMFNPFSESEVFRLVQLILDSGSRLYPYDWPTSGACKHSTGGLGDKTSLIIAPILAALGIPVPMMSGRTLGHTGGTVDKLESIPGFKTNLSLLELKSQVSKINLAMIAQTEDLCPGDRKLYALRDATSTVESIELIAASIMSKKIAEGIRYLVLDVKYGNGAFIEDYMRAETLLRYMMKIGSHYGVQVIGALSEHAVPLGVFVGNACEVFECLEIFKYVRGEKLHDSFSEDKNYEKYLKETLDFSISLLLPLVNTYFKISLEETHAKVHEALHSGKAFEKFRAMVKFQGGDLDKFSFSPGFRQSIRANAQGYIQKIDMKGLGFFLNSVGAGRVNLTDVVEPHTGLRWLKKIGCKVQSGEPILQFFSKNDPKFCISPEELENQFLSFIKIGEDFTDEKLNRVEKILM